MKLLMKILTPKENTLMIEREVVDNTVEILKTATPIQCLSLRLESIGYELLDAEIIKDK